MPLDVATVVAMHRMMRQTPGMADQGIAVQAVRGRQFEVLQVLHTAGELADNEVANACIAQAVALRDPDALRWLVQRGLQPAVVKHPPKVAGRMELPRSAVLRDGGLNSVFVSRGAGADAAPTWVEGLRILLDAGAMAPSDYVAPNDHWLARTLLERVLDSSAPEFALEMLDRGAVADGKLLHKAFLTANLEVASRFAKETRSISLKEVNELRFEIENRDYFKKIDKAIYSKFIPLLEAVAGEVLQVPAKELESRSGIGALVSRLGEFRNAKAVHKIVQRLAHKADELLFYGARHGFPDVVEAALAAGARTESDDKTLKIRALMNEKAQRNFSPYPVHNAATAQVLQQLITAGADLSVKWEDEGVLHRVIRVLSAINPEGVQLREGQAMFGMLHAAGVDFTEGANGRSLQQIAAPLKEPLRRVLTSIRTGDYIAGAMTGGEPDDPGRPKVVEPGVI